MARRCLAALLAVAVVGAHGARVGSHEGAPWDYIANATAKVRSSLMRPFGCRPKCPRDDGLTSELTASMPVDLVGHVLGLVPGRSRVAWWLGNSDIAVVGPEEAPEPHVLNQTGRRILDMKFLPEEGRLLVASKACLATVWDTVRAGRPRRQCVFNHTLPEPYHYLYDMQALPGGQAIATLGSDGTIIFWNIIAGEMVANVTLQGVRGHTVMRVLGEDCLVTGVTYITGDPAVVWSLPRRAPEHYLRQPGGSIRLLEASPCGAKLATTGWDGMVYIWDARRGRLERELRTKAGRIGAIAISWGGARVVGSAAGRILIWDGVDTNKTSRWIFLGHGDTPVFAITGPDHLVAVAGSEAAIWNVRSARRVRALKGYGPEAEHLVQDVAAAWGGHRVAACGSRPIDDISWVRVWDVTTGRLEYQDEMRRHPREQMRCGVAAGAASLGIDGAGR